MVIFLQFSVSGNAISIVATHKILLTDLFPSKVRRLKWLEKLSFFKIFKNCQFSNLHIFTDYQKVTNFITVLYWKLLALYFLILNMFVSGLD